MLAASPLEAILLVVMIDSFSNHRKLKSSRDSTISGETVNVAGQDGTGNEGLVRTVAVIGCRWDFVPTPDNHELLVTDACPRYSSPRGGYMFLTDRYPEKFVHDAQALSEADDGWASAPAGAGCPLHLHNA